MHAERRAKKRQEKRKLEMVTSSPRKKQKVVSFPSSRHLVPMQCESPSPVTECDSTKGQRVVIPPSLHPVPTQPMQCETPKAELNPKTIPSRTPRAPPQTVTAIHNLSNHTALRKFLHEQALKYFNFCEVRSPRVDKSGTTSVDFYCYYHPARQRPTQRQRSSGRDTELKRAGDYTNRELNAMTSLQVQDVIQNEIAKGSTRGTVERTLKKTQLKDCSCYVTLNVSWKTPDGSRKVVQYGVHSDGCTQRAKEKRTPFTLDQHVLQWCKTVFNLGMSVEIVEDMFEWLTDTDNTQAVPANLAAYLLLAPPDIPHHCRGHPKFHPDHAKLLEYHRTAKQERYSLAKDDATSLLENLKKRADKLAYSMQECICNCDNPVPLKGGKQGISVCSVSDKCQPFRLVWVYHYAVDFTRRRQFSMTHMDSTGSTNRCVQSFFTRIPSSHPSLFPSSFPVIPLSSTQTVQCFSQICISPIRHLHSK